MKKSIPLLAAFLIFLLVCAGCAAPAPNADLTQVMAQMEEQAPLGEMMDLDENDLTDLYGIKPEDVEQFKGKLLSDGVNPDELVMIKAKDADAAGRIQKALEDRLQSKANEAKNYNPDGYALIQKSSVQVKGTYVCMLVSPKHEKLQSIYDEWIK